MPAAPIASTSDSEMKTVRRFMVALSIGGSGPRLYGLVAEGGQARGGIRHQ